MLSIACEYFKCDGTSELDQSSKYQNKEETVDLCELSSHEEDNALVIPTKEVLQSLHMLSTFGMNSLLSRDFHQHLSNIESETLDYSRFKPKQIKKSLILLESNVFNFVKKKNKQIFMLYFNA